MILSGGFGTRLWPISQPHKPKQFLPYFNGKTLFQHCLERNETLVDEYLVVTNQGHADLATPILEINAQKPYSMLLEPEARNSAAAIGWACSTLEPETLVLVSPSDQIIEKESQYRTAIQRAFELAEEGKIVTLGITPTEPHTGFGYIQSNGEDVIQFVEKPDVETAKTYLAEGNYSWNAGMFIFKAGVLLEELKKHEVEVYNGIVNITDKNLQEAFPLIKSTSIDYAVMEKSDEMAIVKADLGWTDLGSLEAFFGYLQSTDTPPTEYKGGYTWSELEGSHLAMDSNLMQVCANNYFISLPFGEGQRVKEVMNSLVG